MNSMRSGWFNGFIGVVIFSGSLPATRVAVSDFDPMFLTLCRATIAGLLAIILLALFDRRRPSRTDIAPLFIVAIGVVVGFPLLTALALTHIEASHSIVFIGLLPLMTAIFGSLRGGERPRLAFWAFSLLGSCLVAGFALSQNLEASLVGDAFMLGAIVVCGLGYAEGARLSRRLGGWQVICWALVIPLPAMGLLTFISAPDSFFDVEWSAWISLAYVSVFSMLIGFVFWYRGLAQGGIAAVGQLQLLQPFLGLLLAAILLGESVSPLMALTSIAVVACVVGAKRYA